MPARYKYKVNKSSINGVIKISGAKNSVLRLMAASILTSDEIILENYPDKLLDVQVHQEMLSILGKEILLLDGKRCSIRQREECIGKLLWEGRSIRNTLLILGALVARHGYGKVPLPGGCRLGERKFDLHVMLLEKLGAAVSEDGNYLVAEAPNGLVGTDIELPMRSTGATENSIICGVLAKGRTTIWNPHIRPEIMDLVKFLKKCGAEISVFGQERIVVEGVGKLSGCRHEVIADNMEALTWVIAATITGGKLEIQNFPFEDLEVPLAFLKESGVVLFRADSTAYVGLGHAFPIEISTGPYPGINSDMQPLFAVFGAMSKGKSKIVDMRFPGRYGYADELRKMGVTTSVIGDMLSITGGDKLSGSTVNALDLRAGAALLLAGLVSEGETTIENAWQIERGYEDIVPKLKSVGAAIEVIGQL